MILHYRLPAQMVELLADYCADRMDKPPKATAAREILALALDEHRKAKAKRIELEHRATLLAARASKLSRSRKPRPDSGPP